MLLPMTTWHSWSHTRLCAESLCVTYWILERCSGGRNAELDTSDTGMGDWGQKQRQP